MIRRGIVALLSAGLLALFVAPMVSASTQTAAVHQASENAEAWLKLMDAGQYKASWNQASSLFKSHITAKEWAAKASAALNPLGPVKSRELKAAVYKTSLPGAPDGKYVILHFASSFTHKKAAIETVVMMLDKDGKWRTSGYFIH